MDKVNYIWEWIERFGEFGNRDVVWAEKLGERLKELLPYLLRDQEMATRVPCENFLAGGGCQAGASAGSS